MLYIGEDNDHMIHFKYKDDKGSFGINGIDDIITYDNNNINFNRPYNNIELPNYNKIVHYEIFFDDILGYYIDETINSDCTVIIKNGEETHNIKITNETNYNVNDITLNITRNTYYEITIFTLNKGEIFDVYSSIVTQDKYIKQSDETVNKKIKLTKYYLKVIDNDTNKFVSTGRCLKYRVLDKLSVDNDLLCIGLIFPSKNNIIKRTFILKECIIDITETNNKLIINIMDDEVHISMTNSSSKNIKFCINYLYTYRRINSFTNELQKELTLNQPIRINYNNHNNNIHSDGAENNASLLLNNTNTRNNSIILATDYINGKYISICCYTNDTNGIYNTMDFYIGRQCYAYINTHGMHVTGEVFTSSSTTITHYCYVEDDITKYYVGMKVYMSGEVYTKELISNNDHKPVYKFIKLTKEMILNNIEQYSTDCCCSVINNGYKNKFVGVVCNIDLQNNAIKFTTHGDYIYKVDDTSIYSIGDYIEDIGKVTKIIDNEYLCVFKN